MDHQRFRRLGLEVPRLLLPSKQVDTSRWAVIACDQHTSDPAYWEEVARIAGDHPSTLQLILPEAHLEASDKDERIARIHQSMRQYLEDGTLTEYGESGVLVRRELPDGGTRWGLVLALDLEAYDYDPDSKKMVRATEGTILERIPPRVSIRKNASVELPHILMMLDDPERSVIEPLSERSHELSKLYDDELMLDGGRVSGYAVEQESHLAQVASSLEALLDPNRLQERYGETDPLLMAVGDGNHSLAAAKTVWEELKAGGADPETHPARFALVEIVNLYDSGLRFEPIHRVVFGVDRDSFIAGLTRELGAQRIPVEQRGESEDALARRMVDEVAENGAGGLIGILAGDKSTYLSCNTESGEIPGVLLQRLLDADGSEGAPRAIDYIHEPDTVASLCREEENLGIILPPIPREMIFPHVVKHGPLPRKMFSMGESAEKRYYLEARRIDAYVASGGS
jgi:hypothetical protein